MEDLNQAIQNSQRYLLSIQNPAGYWWAELESNVTMTAEVVLLHKIWGTDTQRPLAKAETYIRSQQRSHGGWELFYGDGGELSTSIEAYLGLRLLGVPPTDPQLVAAREFILQRGGITRARVFTKLHLALIGCYPWEGIPSLPAWFMLIPPQTGLSIYEMSSWARGSTVPLLIVLDRKPVFPVRPGVTLEELYREPPGERRYELPPTHAWTDVFLVLDGLFKLGERLDFVPLRTAGLQAAEKWILEHQEATGDWGGIIPAMLNSLLALRCLDYHPQAPEVHRGLAAVDRFVIETDTTYRVQPCVSPVWDTALVVRALVDSGLAPDHPSLVKAGHWLLQEQILDPGDWSVKNPTTRPGGWAFEFQNRFYPDVDDSAVVIMALEAIAVGEEEARKRQAMERGLDWVFSMQCSPGGWAAFDLDNNADWLNDLPYGDLRAMIDPNTADVTARVLEMVGRLGYALSPDRLERAIDYLRREQLPAGCWFGRWGVNYIYGTSGVLVALALGAPQVCRLEIGRGAEWLVSCQNPDGGWGETCQSYTHPHLKGQGPSTASQTAWALIGLLAAGDALGSYQVSALNQGVTYLLKTQTPEGTWDEAYFTGTGFPGHFYLKYHLYQQHFPLTALGRYRALRQQLDWE